MGRIGREMGGLSGKGVALDGFLGFLEMRGGGARREWGDDRGVGLHGAWSAGFVHVSMVLVVFIPFFWHEW